MQARLVKYLVTQHPNMSEQPLYHVHVYPQV